MQRFTSDIKNARTEGANGVFKIGKGDTEGEVTFSWTHDQLEAPVTLSMIALDISGYPSETQWLVFLHDDMESPESLRKAVDSLPSELRGKGIHAAIEKIASKFTTIITAGESASGEDLDDMEIEDEEQLSDSDEEVYDSDDDDFGLSSDGQRLEGTAEAVTPALEDDTARITSELRIARGAGVRVGKVSAGPVHTRSIFSISVRAASLGLQEETLAAWDVQPADYIVLLIRYNGGFPPVKTVLGHGRRVSVSPTFRIGRCRKYKPSHRSAAAAFGMDSDRIEAGAMATEEAEATFSPMFMSASLDNFMNNEFFTLITLHSSGFSWEGANEVLQTQAGIGDAFSALPAREHKQKEYSGPADWLLTPDHLLDGNRAEKSLPLIAMQFAIYHVANCVEFCMVCHRKVDSGFEAIKPFVCERPLCLFQYMNLGFGPSLEHAIQTEGHVVDLLIGFCNAGLMQHKLREWPNGLGMRVPLPSTEPSALAPVPDSTVPSRAAGSLATASVAQPLTPQNEQPSRATPPALRVQFNLPQCRLNIIGVKGRPDGTDVDIYRNQFGLGTWFILEGGVEGDYHCRISGQNGSMMDFEVLIRARPPLPGAVFHSPSARNESGSPMRKRPQVEVEDKYVEGTVDPYWHDLDELPQASQIMALAILFQTLPSVEEMGAYLDSHPGCSLSLWDRIPPAALVLLRWIVASNRSYIQYLQPGHPDLIPGVPSRWKQFHFAQGSVEKEAKFRQALSQDVPDNPASPTLFAWHGSPLCNWHSIVREGLDFRETLHGRAYGHGVYMAPDIATSANYSRPVFISPPDPQLRRIGYATKWEGSLVPVSSAIALCEVVNNPSKFVSSTPHYVVDKPHWIQCRYLLIPPLEAAGANYQAIGSSSPVDIVPKLDEVKYLAQDSKHKVVGPGGLVLDVPAASLPKWRRPEDGDSPKTAVTIDSRDDDDDALSDVELLKHAAEEAQLAAKGRGGALQTGEAKAEAEEAKPYILDPSKTDFRPGHLDATRLPKLAQPVWSTRQGQRQIQHQIKAMVDTMRTTPLHEMGWYVDFENMDNLYQWVVELHSFDPALPLAKDMKAQGITSVVLEVRFGRDYPISPPFVRVVQPIFKTLQEGGGGHVQTGGAICIELLTASGWSPVAAMENVIIQIRSAISSTDMPARLSPRQNSAINIYTPQTAMDGYQRSINFHKWKMPTDTVETARQQPIAGNQPGSSFP